MTHLGGDHADQHRVEQEIRAFNLVTEPVLDDREVEELSQAVAFAAILGGESLGALTRRESNLAFGDLLIPIDKAVAETKSGVRFSITTTDDDQAVVGVLFCSSTNAVALADIFFGGPGEGTDRRLTEIEARSITTSIGGVISPVLSVVTGREGCRVALTHVKQAPLPGEDLVELSVLFTVGANTVECALFLPNPDGATSGGSFRDIMIDTVKEMPVRIDVDLAQVEMGALDVQALADGDIVIFDSAPDSDATLRNGASDLLRGRIAERGGRRVLEVTELLVPH